MSDPILERRRFRQALRAGLVPGQLLRVNPTVRTSKKLRPLKNHLLVTRLTNKLIEDVSDLESDELVLYFQNFIATFAGAIDANMAVAFAQMCSDRARQFRTQGETVTLPNPWYRFYSLQAVGAIHSLTSVPATDADELRSLACTTHEMALDQESEFCSREILDIFWQNMTWALMKSPEEWMIFRAGPDLILKAIEVCQSFLKGDESCAILLTPALSAWRFLLTYEQALRSRNDELSAKEFADVRTARKRIADCNTSRFVWFAKVVDCYPSRSGFLHVPPPSYEALICRPKLDGLDRQAADLALIQWLQNAYESHRIAVGKIKSNYSTVEREQLNEEHSLSNLINYGVDKADWITFKEMGRGLFTDGTTKYLERKVKQRVFSAQEAQESDESGEVMKNLLWNRHQMRRSAQLLPMEAHRLLPTLEKFEDRSIGVVNRLLITITNNVKVSGRFTQRAHLSIRRDKEVSEISFSGTIGSQYRIEGSENLVNWISLGNSQAPTGVGIFTDLAGLNLSSRFYRAVSIEP